MPRLFVAVEPPPDLVEQAAALPRPAVPGLRWTGPDQWHVTLRFLGRVEELAPAVAALGAMQADAAEAEAGPAVSRFGQRVLQVPVAGLGDLAQAVVKATAGLGQPPEDRPFAGHLTLARARKGSRIDLRALCGGPVEATWTVRELCLVESHLSRVGARYEIVERFPLPERSPVRPGGVPYSENREEGEPANRGCGGRRSPDAAGGRVR